MGSCGKKLVAFLHDSELNEYEIHSQEEYPIRSVVHYVILIVKKPVL